MNTVVDQQPLRRRSGRSSAGVVVAVLRLERLRHFALEAGGAVVAPADSVSPPDPEWLSS